MMIDPKPSAPCDTKTLLEIAHTMSRDQGDALDMIESALAQHPQDARLWLMRGSMYVAMSRGDAAREDLTRAVELAPGLHIARFMLGLQTHIDQRHGEAEQVWEPLRELPENDCLRVFADGLRLLAHDQFVPALVQLERGLELNRQYPQVSYYINHVVASLREVMASGAAPADGGAGKDGGHLPPSDDPTGGTRH